MATSQSSAVMPAAMLMLQNPDKPAKMMREEEEALQRRERRRHQCRVSQRRYRDKQGSAEYNLKLDVNNLREHVQRLQGMRELLETKIWSSRLVRDGAAVKAAEKYYTVFSHGMHNPEAGGDHVRKCFDMQVTFVKAFMDDDVEFGDSRGVSAVLNQWHLYTQFHATLSVRMLSAEVCGTEETPIVVVKGVLAVRMNRSTIENMFPHIVANEDLVQVLLSREIEYPTSTTYVFNSRLQVERQDLDVDFLAGINHCLGSTYASSRVLQRALISDCCKLGQVSHGNADNGAGLGHQVGLPFVTS
ncbi:hypothetical protein F444_20111 [Phytophthora nicotianae P1976]|uniref:BZIP domain-containing protein n=1 Tax=Phytophthora nicotianae P1976 TaxID=1317066 RepID=A0A080Z5N4_PHYNI|nr:hypothetical protein F444_20111 [Phytophthora nicotianae P1976]